MLLLKHQKSRFLFWKLCLLSFFLHGITFGIPWPQNLAQKEDGILRSSADDLLEPSEPLTISAVALPKAARPAEEATVPSQQESLALAKTELPTVSSPVPSLSPEQLYSAQAAQPTPSAVSQPTQPEDPQQNLQQGAAPSSLPLEEHHQKPLEEMPSSSTSSSETPSSTSPELTNPLGATPEYGKVMPLSQDFPDLADVQTGCYGVEGCRQLSGNFRRAAQQLKEQMEASGYQLTERNDIENTGHRVFEVIAPQEPDKTYYLNVFSPDIGSAVYVLSVEILSLEELQALSRA